MRLLQCPSRYSYTTDPFLNKLCKPRASTSEQKPRLNTVVCRTFSCRISQSSCPKNLPSIPQTSCTGSIARCPAISQPTPGTEETFCSIRGSCTPELLLLQQLHGSGHKLPRTALPKPAVSKVNPLNLNSSSWSLFIYLSRVRLSSPWR